MNRRWQDEPVKRISGKIRCSTCRRVTVCFRYDGFDLCEDCKAMMQECDDYDKKSVDKVKPAKSKAREQSEKLQKAKEQKKGWFSR